MHQQDPETAVDVSGWTNDQDAKSHKKRFNIIDTIIRNCSLDHLRTIVKSGWDVDERQVVRYHGYEQKHETALHKAARRCWTEGVRVLVDAEADCNIPGAVSNPLTLAVHNRHCPPELVELLLNHGADPNDHNDGFDTVPLGRAIYKSNWSVIEGTAKIVQLLLDHGANPNATGARWCNGSYLGEQDDCPFSAALDKPYELFGVLFKLLLQFGADAHCKVAVGRPLFHAMMNRYCSNSGHYKFLQEQFDLYFLQGGNIDIEDGGYRTPLKHAVRNDGKGFDRIPMGLSDGGNSNNVRWLIRHGADTSPIKFTLLKEHFIPQYHYAFFPETPLLLLQAGMRVPPAAQTQLRNIAKAISTWLQDGFEEDEDVEDILMRITLMWRQLEEAEEEQLHRMWNKFRKSTFPQYQAQQMTDLQEFSDGSLDVYPEDIYVNYMDKKQELQNILDKTQKVLGFLGQTQSLQWYCRHCVRENLVSLQPSVVKTLPITAILKRYILCHDL